MITTKSTFDEINEVIKKAYDPISTRSYNYSKAHKREFIAACEKHPYFTPTHEVPYKTDGITIKTVEVGVHMIKVDGEFRKKHNMTSKVKAIGFDLQEYLMYSIMNDLETNKKVFVDFGFSWRHHTCTTIVFYSTHAIQRYSRRNFPDETLTFEETCSRLIRRTVDKGFLTEPRPYGMTPHLSSTILTADGVFFGYRDDERNVFCMDTFVTYDMIPKETFGHILDGYDNMVKARDQIINNEKFMYECSVPVRTGFTYMDGDFIEDGYKEMTQVKDMDKDYLKKWKKVIREHYTEKMKRKGYT